MYRECTRIWKVIFQLYWELYPCSLFKHQSHRLRMCHQPNRMARIYPTFPRSRYHRPVHQLMVPQIYRDGIHLYIQIFVRILIFINFRCINKRFFFFFLAPPSYQESQHRNTIVDKNDTQYTRLGSDDTAFAPRYPTFGPSAPPNQ